MLSVGVVAVLASLLGVYSQDVTVPEAKFFQLPSGGLRIEVPDISGLTEVDIHFSVNKPVSGVSAADYNIMIRSSTNGVWMYEDAAIAVVPGDTVYYWILVFVNGGGYQKTDLSGAVTGSEPPTTTSTTQKTTTEKVTTTARPTTTTTVTTTTTGTTGPPLPRPMLEKMVPMGFRMCLEDYEGLTHVGFHFSVNEDLDGIDYGQENIELDSKGPDGTWCHSWPTIRLNDGDTVNYWYYLVIDRHGYQITDLHWTIGETVAVETTTVTTPQPGTTVPDILSVTESNVGKYFTPGQLIFEDNFDFFDEYTWENEITMAGGGNWEFQMYTHNKSNTYTRDGNLYLKPTLTADWRGEESLTKEIYDLYSGTPGSECTMDAFYGCFRVGTSSNIINPIMSGRIRSAKAFSFMYGKVETRARMPVGDWLWPAIWLLPKRSKYGQWPASGEIDILESRGNTKLTMNGEDIGVGQFGSTLQYGGGYPLNGYLNAHCVYNLPGGAGFHEDFHTYGLDWTPDYLAFSIDGVEFCKVEPPAGGFWELGEWHETDMLNPWDWGRNKKIAPFDEQFFLVLNVAVGGTGGYFPDEASNGNGKPWSNQSPTAMMEFWNAKGSWLPTWNLEENNGEGAAMVVDYIRVWASDVVKEA